MLLTKVGLLEQACNHSYSGNGAEESHRFKASLKLSETLRGKLNMVADIYCHKFGTNQAIKQNFFFPHI